MDKHEQDSLRIRPMICADIAHIHEIELQSFSLPWSPASFVQELTQNPLATYVVMDDVLRNKVVGYAGMWRIYEEAHITNIAVRETYRGQKCGYRLLEALFWQAYQGGARHMTLEVRPSNAVARKLYGKFGFYEAGVRRRYYTDNGEDALILWCDRVAEIACGDKGGAHGCVTE